jgi:glutamate mutase epsilon subunit
MKRIEEHKAFLEALTEATVRNKKLLIKNATLDEVKTLYEVISNFDGLQWSNRENKKLKKHKKEIKTFLKKRWDVSKLRKYFITRTTFVSEITCAVLNKLLDSYLCEMFNNE